MRANSSASRRSNAPSSADPRPCTVAAYWRALSIRYENRYGGRSPPLPCNTSSSDNPAAVSLASSPGSIGGAQSGSGRKRAVDGERPRLHRLGGHLQIMGGGRPGEHTMSRDGDGFYLGQKLGADGRLLCDDVRIRLR